MEEKKLSFEEAMERLTDIVSKLESGNQPLADMISLYEEGMMMCKYCTSLLDGYSAKIEMLHGTTVPTEEV